ncbi:glycyl-tRNA ligase [Halorubrum distributum JCM 9100]|uniref:glycine--tRNA ligase n=3 Tax=Halorubrum distributum TaxID=29283 RepID=M0EJK3_9EURY|nr:MULTISPECIES: glycine--tRNA ligase [Halorubrum distributum group]ELZ47935.1 glycyl-tRNA ligase [Halorubrum distributum JCM 9100]ELZ54194.1 glycyl-tRNA ligase [Halorubrum distributum JCM 10118]MYL69080.1 glycine--tRNA ligase [Halorubrum terrestre]
MAADALAELAKRRGFFFGSNGAYGGTAGFYTFGPQGAALKRNVEDAWRDRFTIREGNREIEAPTVMPEAVFEASGHLEGFDDMLVECPECGESHRADHLVEDATDVEDAEALPGEEVAELIAEEGIACPACGTELAGQPVEAFNLMFATDIGPGDAQPGYLRPETAQGIFVEFPRLKEYARGNLPFGITQIGPAYRNEISPRGGLLRLREFTQAELEQFIDPEEDEPPLDRVRDVEVRLYPATEQEADDGDYLDTTVGEAVDEGVIGSPWVGYYLGVAQEWYERVGVDLDRFRFRQHLAGERAHYAADCWDAESEVGGDWIEIAGFAYRGDYDLSKHDEYGDDAFTVFKRYDEPKTVERATVDPDMSVLGPEFGGDAAAVAEALETLAERDPDSFDGETVAVDVNGKTREVDADVANFSVEEVTESGEHITPHVVEPSFGVGRTVQTLLAHAYSEDEVDGEERTYLSLEPAVAPQDAAVFPLVTNDDRLTALADEVAADLRAAGLAVAYDDSGSIGRRYRRQDEVGTPFCVTVDRDGIEGDGPDTVTLRERDSAAQVRVPVADLADELTALREGEPFASVADRYDAVDTDVETAGN